MIRIGCLTDYVKPKKKMTLNALGEPSLKEIQDKSKFTLRFRKMIQHSPHSLMPLTFRYYFIPSHLLTCRKQSKNHCANAKFYEKSHETVNNQNR